MAIAAPARRSDLQTAPRPATAPPEPRKRPRDRPRPGGQGRSTATASVATPAPPKRKSGSTKRKAAPGAGGTTAPGRKKSGGRGKGPGAGAGASPIRRIKSSAATKAASVAPVRKAPARRKVAPRRRPAGVIPIAANGAVRGAVAVTQLPESGLIHRLTRGRAWIGVLGVLLVGIVALNVVTLSFAATAGKIDEKNQELGKENTMLQGRYSAKYGVKRLTGQAKKLGLGPSTAIQPEPLAAHAGDVATAAARLSAAAAAASSGGEVAEGGGAATAGGGSGEAVAGGEETASGEAGESEFTPEELEIYEREYAELLASEGGE